MRKASWSPISSMSGIHRGLLVASAAVTLSATGCGDGPICPAEIFVAITAPAADSDVRDDVDAETPGVQIDVQVRSSLVDGQSFTLTVTGEDGGNEDYQAVSDAEGDVVFENVTVPAGAVTLRVDGTSEDCGDGSDEIEVNVVAGAGCVLTVREEPIENDYYAPLPVLNASNDADADTANFQANIDIESLSDYEVELFVLDVDAATENSAGQLTADADGAATFAITLAQGRQALRAVCVSPNSSASPSITTTVFVDTVPPTCAVTAPTPGQTLIPELDEDDQTDGLQITLEGQAATELSDVAGEAAAFHVDGPEGQTDLDGTDLDVEGYSTAAAELLPDGSYASYDVTFSSQDHADNGCTVTETYGYEADGCSIVVTAPTDVLTEDADGSDDNGVQVDVTVEVGIGCIGQIVTSDCGDNDPSGMVPVGGELTLRVDLCEGATCEVTEVCQLAVTSPDGIDTAAGANLQFDNIAPLPVLLFSDPPLACGSQATDAADVDGNAGNGVQLDVTVIAPGAVLREVETTPEGGSTTTTTANPGNGTARITVDPGDNNVVAAAEDGAGNRGETADCIITMADLAVSFSPPVADGLVGAGDGVVSGSDLTLDICGTVSDSGATVDLEIDDAAAEAASVTGTTWCLDGRSLEEGDHTIRATATGTGFGSATLDLTVDLTAPGAIADFSLIARSRRALEAEWTAPAGADTYLVKVSATALTDGNFDSTGIEVLAGVPGAPGSLESVVASELRAGTPYWLGVAAVDAAGNRTVAAIGGPLTPDFDATGAISPVEDGGATAIRFGYAITRGRFNADSFDDVAIAAPYLNGGLGAVYIYFGSAGGVGATPDVTINGADAGGYFGWSLTTVKWSSAVYDDLVVGAVFATSSTGKVYVFDGGSGLDAGTYTTTAADVLIGVNPSANWFTGSLLGYAMAAADFNGDNTDDLALTAPGGGSGAGGVAILYGGTATTPTINLSDLTASQMSNAIVERILAPEADVFEFGAVVTNMGPTMGASDDTDDLAVSYVENDSVFVFRGDEGRPATAGVHDRPFSAGADLKIDSGSADTDADFGSAMGSIADLNGDGARELVLGAMREGANIGRVVIVDGNTVGTASIASTVGFALTIITPAGSGSLFGAAIANNGVARAPDIDGDGAEDLVFAGRAGTMVGEGLFVWFGGSIPLGSTTSATAGHVVEGPPQLNGSAISTIWAGDVNGDDLEDICWADWNGTTASDDGSFEVLWDDGV